MVLTNTFSLEDILSETQVKHIIRSTLGVDDGRLVGDEIKPATDGMAGFLGDHLKVALHVQSEGVLKIISLFVKRLPIGNKPKADFIDDNDYYRREQLVYKLFEDFKPVDDTNPWGVKAYIYTDSLFVLPDLSVLGYASRDLLETFDLTQVMLVVSAVARFHAEFANFEAKKSSNGKTYTVLQEYGHVLTEPTFKDTPWVYAAAKLTTNFLTEYSSKYRNGFVDLEGALTKLYIEACDSLKDYEGTLNVLIHKDLWTNNIMFKYVDGVPVNAVIIDYQCVRYGPPAFDLMILLYLTTTRKFREAHEAEILRSYYKIFCNSLEEETKVKLKGLGYDEENFLEWCERGRMFGLFEALGILPYVLMDAKNAEKTFDDPETFENITWKDRTEPVISYSRKYEGYRDRNLEVSEEFVDRYVLKGIS